MNTKRFIAILVGISLAQIFCGVAGITTRHDAFRGLLIVAELALAAIGGILICPPLKP